MQVRLLSLNSLERERFRDRDSWPNSKGCIFLEFLPVRPFHKLPLVVHESDLAILSSDLATTKLMFLAKLHAWTRQPKVPPIQIYYVKYLAKSLVRPDRFHEPPVVTCGRYEWVIERCKDITILEAPANYT